MKEQVPLDHVKKYFGKNRRKDTAQLEKRIWALKLLEKCCPNSPEPLGRIMKNSSALEIKELTIVARLFSVKSGQKFPILSKSPLHWAALRGIPESFKKIYNSSLDRNQVDHYGFHPLHYAARPGVYTAGFLEICDFIIKRLDWNDEENNPKNNFGNTPLHLAAKSGHLPIVKVKESRDFATNQIS